MSRLLTATTVLMLVACDGAVTSDNGDDDAVAVSQYSLKAQEAAHATILKFRPQASQFMVEEMNATLAKNGIVGTLVRDIETRMMNPLTDGAADTSCPYLSPRSQDPTVSCRFLVDQALSDALTHAGPLDDSVEQNAEQEHATAVTGVELQFIKDWGHKSVASGIQAAATHAIEFLRSERVCDQAPTNDESAFNLGLQQGKALLEAAEQQVLPTIAKTQCNTDLIALTVLGEAQTQGEEFKTANPVCAGYTPADLAELVDLRLAGDVRAEGLAEGLRQAHEALRVRLVSTWECEACVCYARYNGAGPVFCFKQSDVAGREPRKGSQAQELAQQIPTVPQAQCSSSPIPLGSPLVVDLDGDGIHFSRDRIAFDLAATGECVLIPALEGRDALLARDLDGNGRIDSGAELFGNATSCGRTRCIDGIVALAQHDANQDGVIDERDPVYAELVLWQDADRHGRSTPEELVPLRASGIRAIGLASRLDAGFAGLDGAATRALTFRWADGSTGLVPDVWFRVEFDTLPRNPLTAGL